MLQVVNSTLPLGLDGYAVSCEDSFIDGLTTPQGCVIGNLKYGTKWHTLKHRPFDSSWQIDARRFCKDACEHDVRLNFQNVKFNDSEIGDGKLYIDIYINHQILKVLVNV